MKERCKSDFFSKALHNKYNEFRIRTYYRNQKIAQLKTTRAKKLLSSDVLAHYPAS